MARQLAARGLSLVLVARSVDKLEALAAELGSAHGVGTRVMGADLATSAGIDRLVADVRALDVPVDHLVGNAGFGMYGDFAEGDPAEQRRMVTLNCEAIVALTRATLPGMLERGRGGVLNVASTAAFQPAATFAVYAATKAFVLSFTEALHEEVRGRGVRVMALCPGPVPTGFQQRAAITIAPFQRSMTLSAEAMVRRGLEDYEDGCVVSVPGLVNKLGAMLASTAPRPLVRRVTHALMRSAVRRTS